MNKEEEGDGVKRMINRKALMKRKRFNTVTQNVKMCLVYVCLRVILRYLLKQPSE